MIDIIKTIAIALLVSLVVMFGANWLVGDNQPAGEAVGGSVRTPNSHLEAKSVSWGGNSIATLTDANGGAYALTQAELENSTVLKFAAGGSGQAVIALSFPATSTMTTLLDKTGQCRSWLYDATSLSAGTTTTLTAGTGHNIIAYTTNDDVIDGNEYSQITMCRRGDSNVDTIVTEMLNAD